jgi:competence protein ComEC
MSKSRIFLYALLAFVLGVSLRSFIPVPSAILEGMALLAASVLALGILRRNREVVIAGLLLLGFGGGILRFTLVENSRPNLANLYETEVELRGIVWEEPRRTSASQQLKVRTGSGFYTRVTLRFYPEYRLGDELILRGALEKPANLGDFDYAAYLAKDEIFSIMSFPEIEKIGGGKGRRLNLGLNRAKRAFEANIDSALPEPHAALLKGLILGERESLPPDLVEDFRRTGTSHIVALSGYNITLVGRSFMNFLLLLTAPFYTAFWLAVGAIAAFVILTGASPSVVRAGVMGILVLVAQREGRVYRMTNALVFAAAMMIFHNPRILRFDAAFELSFLAASGIIYLSPHLERRLDTLRHKLSFGDRKLNLERNKEPALFPLKQIFIDTLSAQFMVLPFIIYLFGSVSLVSPASNVLVLLAVPYSMAAGFLTGLSGFFSDTLVMILGWASWVLLEYEIRIIEFFAEAPQAALAVPKFSGWVVGGAYLLLAYWLWKKRQKISI